MELNSHCLAPGLWVAGDELDWLNGLAHLPSDIQQFLAAPVLTAESTPCTATVPSSRVLSFYQNDLPALPSRYHLDDLHTHLSHNYSQLESNHSFIEWWFPLRTPGVNAQAPLLTSNPNELIALRTDPEVQRRFRNSYEIMLDFYGFALDDFDSGRIKRTEHYEARYRNLVKNSHNWLRLSRILESCAEFGLEYSHAAPLLFILVEQNPSSPNGLLSDRSLIRSMDQYWRYCIRNEEEREWVVRVIDEVRRGEREWTQTEYEQAIGRRKVTGTFREDVQAN
ncbi:BZ3500_MvSof-1268-A1-R1_Chr8-2g10227 [Microbotryum saponariae]|uniref:BZ3500_MvSof-1268-A1-R1_Chr8-2g10227 protein n=1 Tax=Microbotryum saponariae TaxID=289078 RepID=A0A2X0LZD2_9BASI|nr:BZ3500_MvSof-1268-A1-R1_Chr8-2g10227 [Microbotryum saponariae]SDA02025.1 BZ3501_MvSof-1269-A2-R1_Chr8-2g09977 [Microbotryum saponariae]